MEKQKRRPGAGRKPIAKELKKVFVSTSISGTLDEINELKEIARKANKSLSRLILDYFLSK